MIETKNLLKEIVEMYYDPQFKIFKINASSEGEPMKTTGYFISLGMTTSLDYLGKLKDILINSDYNFNARVVEVVSTIDPKTGEFLNYLQNKSEDEIQKFDSPIPDGKVVLDEEQAKRILQEMDGETSDGNFNVTSQKRKLKEVIEKIESTPTSWENHGVLLKGTDDYVVFHRKVNYLRDGDKEYRIGVYVEG